MPNRRYGSSLGLRRALSRRTFVNHTPWVDNGDYYYDEAIGPVSTTHYAFLNREWEDPTADAALTTPIKVFREAIRERVEEWLDEQPNTGRRWQRKIKMYDPHPDAVYEDVVHGLVPPFPGSETAIERGCTCDPDANHSGAIPPWQGGWFVKSNCPLHSQKG